MTMDDKELEKKMREEVKQLRRFYEQVTYYCLANGLFILIWALSGFGYFWPFWPLLIGGAMLFVRGEEHDFLPEFMMRYTRLFRSKLPFLREDWAERQVKKRMASRKARAAASSAKHAVVAAKSAVKPVAAAAKPIAKAAISKPAASSSAGKKSTPAKKPTAKKAAPKKAAPAKKPAPKKGVAKAKAPAKPAAKK